MCYLLSFIHLFIYLFIYYHKITLHTDVVIIITGNHHLHVNDTFVVRMTMLSPKYDPSPCQNSTP